MSFDHLNKLLTLVANFGVVAGIFFLAIEVRQNQEMLERDEQARQMERDLRIADFTAFAVNSYGQIREWNVEDPELAAPWNKGRLGENLSPSDQSRFNSMCGERIWSDVLMWERSQILGRQSWVAAVVAGLREDLETYPGIRKCWANQQKGIKRWGYEGFVATVNAGDIDSQ